MFEIILTLAATTQNPVIRLELGAAWHCLLAACHSDHSGVCTVNVQKLFNIAVSKIPKKQSTLLSPERRCREAPVVPSRREWRGASVTICLFVCDTKIMGCTVFDAITLTLFCQWSPSSLYSSPSSTFEVKWRKFIIHSICGTHSSTHTCIYTHDNNKCAGPKTDTHLTTAHRVPRRIFPIL